MNRKLKNVFSIFLIIITLFYVKPLYAQSEFCNPGTMCNKVPVGRCGSAGGVQMDCLKDDEKDLGFVGCCVVGTDPEECPVGYGNCASSDAASCSSHGGIPKFCLGGTEPACCFPIANPGVYPCATDQSCILVEDGGCGSAGGRERACESDIPSGMVGCCIAEPKTADPGIIGDLWDMFYVSETELAADAYNLILPIGIAIGVLSIIIAGYGFMTSQGNPDKVKAAKERLSAAIAGTFFIVLSLVILKVIINTLF